MDRYEECVAELKDMEGQLEVPTFTKTMERDGTTLVVKSVPALVCDTCGDVTYSEAIGRRLREMYEAVKKAGVDTAVRSFEDPESRAEAH